MNDFFGAFMRLKRLHKPIFAVAVFSLLCVEVWAAPKTPVSSSAAASSAPPAQTLPVDLMGRWLNQFQNITVGLQLEANGQCQMFIDRLTGVKSQKKCRFEYYQNTTYWVYLYDEAGKCSTSADYEFAFNANTQTVYFNIGSSMPVEMKKQGQP